MTDPRTPRTVAEVVDDMIADAYGRGYNDAREASTLGSSERLAAALQRAFNQPPRLLEALLSPEQSWRTIAEGILDADPALWEKKP
jgi:hypothetical protein